MKNSSKYLYQFKFDVQNEELCKLECRQVFGKEPNEKTIFSDLEINPSLSPFIKNRLELLASSAEYSDILNQIELLNIEKEGFAAEFLNWSNQKVEHKERREKQKDIGYRINGFPNFEHPSSLYTIVQLGNEFYFGILTPADISWHEHNNKPHSFSSSLPIEIAKVLVSVASKGNRETKILDACCGVGTVLLEARFSNINITGCDINPKTCQHARLNLAHFGYSGEVHFTDVKDLNDKFDVVIIDLPYNLYSYSNESITENIITSGAQLADKLIIVSTSDISDHVAKMNFKVTDYCNVGKRGYTKFNRKIWVCEKNII